MQHIYLFILFLIPISASAQTCDCCELRSKGQKKFDAGDWAGAKTTWLNAQKMPDVAKCPELSGLIKKAEGLIADALKRRQADEAARKAQEIKVIKEPIASSDRDRDGIADKDDQCPDEPGTVALHGCPDLKDDDEDGTPNSQDDCPANYGPKQYRGCPDRDFDEIRDLDDACPEQPGVKATNGCPDRDADSIADKDDKCPDTPGSKSLAGCPDRDNDGLIDSADDCPDIFGLKRFNGCPDKDFDETPDPKDGCPDTPGPKTAYGCPDRDADGVADKDDECPDQLGVVGNKGCPQLVKEWMTYVDGGAYTMGDLFGDDNEIQHTVTLASFYMGKTEVTFDEFDAFCTATSREKPEDAGWGRGQRPVIYVDWYDAVEYCNWLSRQEKLTPVYTIDKTSKDPDNQNTGDTKKYTVNVNWSADGYRLPTEAEWEYAAREGGKKIRFGNGQDTADPAQINFNASASYKKDYSIVGQYRQKTVAVDELAGAVNSLGLRHMSGNVYEWCQDWYGSSYYKQSNGVTDPKGPGSGGNRVVRGGCWGGAPDYCRSASRNDWRPPYRNVSVGFRVVRHL